MSQLKANPDFTLEELQRSLSGTPPVDDEKDKDQLQEQPLKSVPPATLPNISNMTESDMIEYASLMGITDSFRGIKQMAGNAFGWEDTLEDLKTKDKKLHAILAHPEIGTKAMAAFMGSTILLDPVGWIPGIGAVKKAKTIKDMAKYGAMIGGGMSGAGYVSEDMPGIFGERQSRLENVVIGAGAGVLLSGLGGTGANYIAKRKGLKQGLSEDEIVLPYPSARIGKDIDENIEKVPWREVISKKLKMRNASDSEKRKWREKRGFDVDADAAARQERIIKESKEYRQKTGIGKIRESTPMSSVINFYEEIAGKPLKNAIFNNWGSSLSGLGSGIAGYNAFDDENATFGERMTVAIMASLVGYGTVKGLARLKPGAATKLEKGLVDNWGLSEDYIKLKKGTDTERRTIQQKFIAVALKAKENLTLDERKLLYGFMNGDLDRIPNISKMNGGKGIRKEARDLITKYAQEMVDEGLLSNEVFQANKKTYIKRSYLKHEVGSKDSAAFRDVSLIGNELKGRGVTGSASVDAWKKGTSKAQKENKLEDDVRAHWEIAKDKNGKPITLDKGRKYKIKRNFSKKQREEMGEIEDISFAIAETGRLMSNDLAVAKFFRKLASDSKFSIDEKTYLKMQKEGKADGWVRVSDSVISKTPGVKKYGKLAGRYMPKEILDDVTKTYKLGKDGWTDTKTAKALDASMKLWKRSKTAWNPAVHMNNITSNMVMLDFADVNHLWLAKAARELAKGEKSEMVIEARRLGMLDADLLTNELKISNLSNFEKQVAKLKSGDDLNDILSFNTGLMNSLIKGGKKLNGATFGKLEDLYQLEDQVFRMATFMDRLSKGLSPEEAALDGRRWFIDYNINASIVNAAKSTVLPFISYTYRVVPLLAETAIMRPWKFAKWAAAGYGLNQLGKIHGGGLEEAETYARDFRIEANKELSQTMFGIPFMPKTHIKMPFRSASGDSMYLDITRWLPGGDVLQEGEIGARRRSVADTPWLPTPLQPGGLYLDLFKIIREKRDPFTNDELNLLGEDSEEREIAKQLVKSFTPNLPGLGAFNILPESYSTKKIKTAWRRGYGAPSNEWLKENGFDENTRGNINMFGVGNIPLPESRYTTPFGLAEAVLSTLGVKVKPTDISASVELVKLELGNKINGLEEDKKEHKAFFENGEISWTEFQDRVEVIDDKINLYTDRYLAFRIELNNRLVKAGQNPIVETPGSALPKGPGRTKQNVDVKRRRVKFDGGEISEDNPVTNAKKVPAEKINKYTGQAYESEMERLGFKDGLLVSVGVTPVSDKQLGKLKKALKKRQAKAKGGSARNYKLEHENYQSKPEQLKNNAARKRARYAMEKAGKAHKGDGKDVHHKDGNPKNNKMSNLTLVSKLKNRSFSRKSA